MARVGIVGLGFMGMIHYLAYQRVKGAKVVAMCETDPVKLSGDWRGIKGNFVPPGKLLGGHFKRIISNPLWLKDFYDPKKIGGPMLDLHVHDAHIIRLLCGMPKSVCTSGRMRGEVAGFFSSQFVFDDPALSVTAAS